MKKILAAFLLIATTTTLSFAATGDIAATATSGDVTSDSSGKTLFPANAAGTEGPQIGKMSTGVYPAWATLVGNYVVMTQHTSGVKLFASSSDSTAIQWKPATKGAAIAAPAATATGAIEFADGNGWTVM